MECPKCFGEVSTKARKCKHCGSKLPRHVSKVTIVAAFTLLAVWIVSQAMNQISSTSSQPSRQQARTDHKLQAYTCAKMRVEELLKAPSTAEFERHSYKDAAIDMGGERYVVASSVEAQNSFGVPLKKEFICDIQYQPQDSSCQSECHFEGEYPAGFVEGIQEDLKRMGKL